MPELLSDAALLLRGVSAARDLSAVLGELRTHLPRCLPAGAHVDLMVGEQGASHLLVSTADEPHVAGATLDQRLLAYQVAGHVALHVLPIESAGQLLGWLIITHPTALLSAGTLAFAGQVAALLGMRMLYEQSRGMLAQAAAQAQALERRLVATDTLRARATLAAGAAHDIGNLFASVLGHVQLAQQSAPAALRADLRVVEQAARDGHHLLRRVLASQISSPDLPLAASAHIGQVVDDVLRLTEPFREMHPSISVRAEIPDLPDAAIHPAELREVLINLVLNGLAAMPDGGELSIQARQVLGAIQIAVSDTGVGIAQEVRGAIFQPVSSTRTGSGLGLSGSRAVLEAYRGDLDVESLPGEGATFTITLPSI